MTSIIPAPLDRHRETVRPEWIDYNGHMNVSYYVLAFDHATDVWFEHLELGEAYRVRTGCSLFAVEIHVTYLAELRLGDPLRITTQHLGHDDKRLHLFHRMYHAERGTLCACFEALGLNVDMATRKATLFPVEARARIDAVAAAHASLARPPEAGHVMGLKGRSNR